MQVLHGARGAEKVPHPVVAINKPRAEPAAAIALQPPELRGALAGMFAGNLGRTVRCTPWRRTVLHQGPPDLYGKWRMRRPGDARREWHWLHVLPMLGVGVPKPVILLAEGRRTLLVTEAVAGRPMDAWFVDAAAEGWLPQAVDYAVRHVAPLVHRLHAAGCVHRDLYWNHVFCRDPRTGHAPVLIDVERAFRPRWLRRRWIVKDLAGLVSSCPVQIPLRAALRFLRICSGGEPLDPAFLHAIERKAARIRAHVPRFG